MASEVSRIVDQYDRAMTGDAWHGDNVWKILGEVSPEQAFAKPLSGAHTIWELLAHMTFWETVVCRRLRKLPVQIEESLNFPAMPPANSTNWTRQLDVFRKSNSEFREALSQLDDSRLDQPLSKPTKSVYVEVHGVIQHNLYHAGQIAMLRKNLASGKVAGGL